MVCVGCYGHDESFFLFTYQLQVFKPRWDVACTCLLIAHLLLSKGVGRAHCFYTNKVGKDSNKDIHLTQKILLEVITVLKWCIYNS